ncbi:C2 domain-containing protein 3 isoform X2 [Periplaneta americana]|uniref:C2 domain-containing protein 3 isoform X2 n=1 Tax=Periplaneta americana TaxID=6978 RepID=UPI0037E89DA4
MFGHSLLDLGNFEDSTLPQCMELEQRPLNVKTGTSGTVKNTTVSYAIKTSINLFEEYLKDCEGLELSVVNHQLHSVVGHVFIRDVLSLVRKNIYQCYFPILNSFGNRIGDLHVGFSLQSSHHQISPCVMIHNKSREKKVSEPSRQKAVENESSSLKTRNKAPKHYPEYRTIPSSYSLPNLYKSKDSDFIVPDSIISDLLIQGQKLRDAMVKSVLEDGGLELVEKDISDPATESPSVEPLGIWNKNDKETTDEAKVMEFLLGKSMTPQDEDDVVARLKNLSPVASLLEMAEDLAMDEKFVKDQHEAESRIRKMEAEEESSCQFSGAKARKSRNGEEHDIQNAASIKDGAESLQPAPIYHDDLIMQYINSLRITIHSLYLNKIGTKNQSHIQSQMKGSTVHLLHEVPKRCSTAYFVEYELPYQLDPSVKGKKKQIKKNSKPWHNTVKRFCSNKQIGPEIYFEQTSIHMLPITKTPLYSLLNNVNIMFRIYSRQLHQKIPLQIGEAEFKLAKILKSETLGCCEHIEFFCMATIPEHQLCEGVLKVSVDLGLEGKHFGHNFLSLLKPYCYVKAEDINEPNNGASVKRVAVSVAQKALSTTDASHRVQNSTKKLSSKVNKRQTVHKTEHPRPHSQDVCSSTSDSESNKPVLLHSLLHISDGRDFETVNSYLLCRAFWKDDIITSDICWDTGNPHYNFHQLIPVLLSADLLERSHDNFLITELWERKVSSNCDTLIGYAKLPLNKFYVAYRDPEVVAQLLLSKYPVIAIDGWVTVMNPITQMPCGQIQVVLALGTEDQVQLLEVSRGLKETILTPSQCQDSECRMQYGSDIRPGTSKMAEGQITSTEPSLCSVLNNSDIFIENHNVCESQMRHIRPNSGVARGSLRGNGQSLIIQQQDYDLYADSMFTLGSHEPVRNTVTNSVQESTVLNGNKNGRPRNISGNVNGAQDLYIQPRSRIQKDAYVGKVPMHVNGVQVTSSYQSSILNLELIQQRKDEGTKNNGNSLGHVRQFPQRCQPEINGACKDMSVQNHDSVPHVTHTNKITEQNNLPFINEDSNIIQGENSGSQSNIDQQMTQLQVFENSNEHFDSEMDSHEVLNDRFNAFHPTSQTGYHRKHQESQTDLLILDLADCGSLPLQSSSTFNKSTRENLPTDPTFDDTCKDCNRVNEMLNRDASNGDSSNLLHSKLRTKEKSVQFSQQSSDLKINSSEAETNSHANEESEQEISSLTKDNVMTVSDKVLKSGHLLEEPVPLRSADTENYFHVHVEIERAMHLQCFKQQKKNESDTEAEFEPSTYVTFLLKQCCSSSNETDVRVFTPLVPQTVNPVWHWHCDTWLPSDLLTNNGKRLIFKVWQSVDGSSKDPQRDIVLGFATVDLTVLLCGMPWVSGWFNIMDFAGRCAGQIKINVTPLENLNHFIPYIISDNKLMDKECSTHKEEYTSGCICGRNCSDDSMKDNSTMLSSSEANKRICDTHRPTLEKSLRQKPEMSRSKKRGDREASSLKSRKMPDAVVTESLADCETEMQDDMTSSVLAHALKQKLAELDEITQRLKERLHVVTNEDFVAPYLPWLQENEIPIDIQEADDDAYQGSSFKIGSAGSHLNLANGDVYNGGSNVKHTGTSASKEKQTQTHIHKQLQSKLQADTSVRITSDEVSSETHKNHLDKNEGIVGRNAVVKIPNSAENMINRREVIHKPEFQSGYNEKSLRRARTRSPSVEMRQEEGIEEFDKLTDYLMQTSARELELENVFNPLLFQHLLSSCGSVSDCHYRSRYDVENNSDNSTGNTAVTKHQNLKYNIKEGNNTYFCGTKELNCNMSKKKEKINYPAYDMECRTELETSNTKFVEIITLPERECDSAISSAKSTQIDPHLEQEERSSGIPEELFVDTEKCKTAVGSSTNSNSEVSFISGSVSELNISNDSVSDETSHQTSVFVLRQAPEGGNTLEEDNTATPVSITADEFNGLSKGEQTEKQEQDLTCVKPGASHNKEISNDNSFSSSQMMSQCQKHGLENGNEESAIDLSRMWANRKGTHSLINEEKIRQIAKIFNMNVTSSEV